MLKSKERQVLLQLLLAVWLIAQSLVGLAKQDSAQASANGVSAWVTSNPPYQADVPIMATVDAPIAIVQIAHNQGTEQKFDYLLKTCQEVPSGLSVGSAASNLWQLNALSEYFRVHKGHDIDPRLIKETLIEKPKHGEIKLIYESEHDRLGTLQYIPFAVGDRNGVVGYEGKDRVAYLLEFSGKRYKLIINLIVTESGDLTDVVVPNRCPADKLIKINSLFNSATPDVNEKNDYILSKAK